MSKELDALKRLYEDSVDYGENLHVCDLIDDKLYRKRIERIDKDYVLLKQALKRNEPTKVDLETGTCINYVDYYACPNCKGRQVERWHRYCPDCGKKLDWSDDE